MIGHWILLVGAVLLFAAMWTGVLYPFFGFIDARRSRINRAKNRQRAELEADCARPLIDVVRQAEYEAESDYWREHPDERPPERRAVLVSVVITEEEI